MVGGGSGGDAALLSTDSHLGERTPPGVPVSAPQQECSQTRSGGTQHGLLLCDLFKRPPLLHLLSPLPINSCVSPHFILF